MGDLAIPFVTEYHSTQADGKERVRPVTDPLPAQDTSNRFGLAQPASFMMSAGGPECPPRSTEDPAHTVLTRDHIAVVRPEGFTIQVTHQDAPGSDPAARVRSVDEPVQAVTGAHRGELAFVQPFVTTAGGPVGQGRNPQSVDEPVGTVIGENHRALVQPFSEALTSDGVRVANRKVVHVEMAKYTHDILTMEPQNCLLLTFEDGSKWLLDIFFRMFRARELARAQSFPDDYVFKGTSSDIVKQVGNAVPVKLAKALVMEALLQMDWAHA
jgi:DNA (cytosine-5)-methyltransferase 1